MFMRIWLSGVRLCSHRLFIKARVYIQQAGELVSFCYLLRLVYWYARWRFNAFGYTNGMSPPYRSDCEYGVGRTYDISNTAERRTIYSIILTQSKHIVISYTQRV